MVIVEMFKGKSIDEHRVELVERKGTGHPDQICDSVMEAVSLALCREYMARFGRILHHNIDKGLLVAGQVEKRFGGGRVVNPMELVIGDRATNRYGGSEIPVEEIAIEAARTWIGENLRFVDPERHINFKVVLAPGSEELGDIFQRPGDIYVANDTSAAVGYYPLSPTEKVVLGVERFLNGREFKERFPQTGEDVKVMAGRGGHYLDLTIAMPLLAPFVKSEQAYFEIKSAIHDEIRSFTENLAVFDQLSINYNTLDVRGRGLGGVYLSLLGTSAEDADSGQVGRGNRVNGLISINRPMGSEATAGKNPVSHVGKIYNLLAHRIAREIYQGIEGIKEVYVLMLSRIGSPINRPQIATAQLLLEKGRHVDEISARVEEIFEGEMAGISQFCDALIRGEYPVS
ncbi:MAG TPA: methionine adenosyltransferase [Deltaproteobacteria bacterium]|nr:methionine adenosyltransferase [Deltaproteobacteria bacterium]HQB39202.1 methionine adenosyltransferase [Deltaproteobacteria bacterium]